MNRTRKSPGRASGAPSGALVIARVRPDAPKRYPVGYASAYSPTGRRARWQAMVRCPYCSGGHSTFGGTIEDLRGVRSAGCGRGRIWVVIARVIEASEAVPDVAA